MEVAELGLYMRSSQLSPVLIVSPPADLLSEPIQGAGIMVGGGLILPQSIREGFREEVTL